MNLELVEHNYRGFTFCTIKGDDAPITILDSVLEFLDKINIEGKDVIDGGGNIGLYSLEFSKRVGEYGQVYYFELQKEIAGIAEQNFITNKIISVTIFNNALSDKSGNFVGHTAIDYHGEKLSSGGIKTEPSLRGQPHCGEVKTISLDDLNLENVGLIKYDLEGMEPQALEGSWDTIRRSKPYLLIELSPGYLENKEQDTIDRIVKEGYRVIELSDFNYWFEPIL